ncbi:restriction endonuclease subunit R [Caloramator sp. E03]|uniref:DEAD/DEAH box helicase n=1 Tax=Caloramator sp. E03 TaxID=2576307 RepID=UPI0011102240|nr:DEAD/DEAH box helicase family protein [Caloramator sp. E03]QCX33661.1 restriction endonuclease subunit R [Caloramator sp. E03]
MAAIQLKQFQLDAIAELHKAVSGDKRNIILKSGTGSGKTVILSHFINEFLLENPGYVALWFCPGKGNLEEQSKKKMEKYIPNASTCNLQDVLTARGFQEGDTVFVNWELVTKAGNRALMDGEHINLFDAADKAHDNGLKFIVIIDEEHLNKTVKAYDVVELFKPDKIIRASATPEKDPNANYVVIPEERVIATGLIKKLIIINEGIEEGISLEHQVTYLLGLALKKHEQLREAFISVGSVVNPLIVIQIPNKSESLIDSVEEYLENKGITYFNKQLAVWLADKKENLDGIEDNTSPVKAIIIKQAVATGWDCPRAHILVKLRENMSETFEIQTIGRIRRMPEAMHYENTLLDNCYLYTFDEKFKEGVKLHLGNGAQDAKTLMLKSSYRNIKLKKKKISVLTTEVSPKMALEAFLAFLKKNYYLKPNKFDENKKLLNSYKYDMDNEIKIHTYQGIASSVNKKELVHLNQVTIKMLLDTHEHGRSFHHSIGEIGRSIGLTYDSVSNIIRKLFCTEPAYKDKLLSLSPKDLYSFVINNDKRLSEDFKIAISSNEYTQQLSMVENSITEDYYIPREYLFTYDAKQRHSVIYEKNVYDGYLSSASPRSTGEKMFEQYCEDSEAVDWFFKNGDKGNEYFSIVYTDNAGKSRHFYPDYVLGVGDDIWVVEVKGGESSSGQSEDIDPFTEKKMDAMTAYAADNNIKCGVVRLNKHDMRLYITTTKYVEDMDNECWMPLKDVIKKQ